MSAWSLCVSHGAVTGGLLPSNCNDGNPGELRRRGRRKLVIWLSCDWAAPCSQLNNYTEFSESEQCLLLFFIFPPPHRNICHFKHLSAEVRVEPDMIACSRGSHAATLWTRVIGMLATWLGESFKFPTFAWEERGCCQRRITQLITPGLIIEPAGERSSNHLIQESGGTAANLTPGTPGLNIHNTLFVLRRIVAISFNVHHCLPL